MTDGAYKPDVRVEVAWNAGYRTPAVDRVWTDISDYVELEEGLSITYGRSDEFSVADANQLSLTLDNRDARFTWGNAASPYYPNVKLGRPIRVVVSTPDNADDVRFTGFVDGWPVEWPTGGDEYAAVRITATSRMARLGLNTPVSGSVDKTAVLNGADYYWPVTENAGAVEAAEIAGGVALSVTSPTVTFGVNETDGDNPANLGDGRGGAKLTGTAVDDGTGFYTVTRGTLQAELPSPISYGTGTPGGLTISYVTRFLNPTDPTIPTSAILAGLYDGDPSSPTAFAVISTDDTYFGVSSVVRANYGSHIASETGLRHLAITVDCDGTNMTVSAYLDGVPQDDTVAAAQAVASLSLLQFEWPADSTSGAYRNVLLGRVGVWDRALTADEVADVAAASLTGFAGDTTDERFERYAAWSSIPDDEVVSTASPVALSGTEVEGQQALALMRDVETAEAGVLHDDRLGRLTLRPRSARYGVASSVTLDCAAERVGSDYSPQVDRQSLYNIGEGTNSSGDITSTYTDESSREEYGDSTYQVQTLSSDPDEPLNLAAWVVVGNAEPQPRASSVTVDLMPYLTGTTAGTDLTGPLRQLDIGSKITVDNAPSQAPGGTSTDYFVEGYAEEIGLARWSMTFNLSPSSPYDEVLILDSATDGVLDTNILAL